MPVATARHILVNTEEKCNELKTANRRPDLILLTSHAITPAAHPAAMVVIWVSSAPA